MKKVIAISAGHESSKKPGTFIRKRIRYLNYGLLGLATILDHKGNIDISVFQADVYSVEQLFGLIEGSGIDIERDCECFLLSIPSYYSITWCVKFCEIVNRRYQKRIIVGGRWVVDNHSDWVRDKLKYVDAIIEGFGERQLAKYFKIPDWDSIPNGSVRCFDWIDYRLLYDYQLYQPCIEISRGCGAGCQFCADKNNRRIKNKPVENVMTELDFLDLIYERYSVYFEAPHFIFEREWINRLCDRMATRSRPVSWRCTSRVETVPIDQLRKMGDAGLRILDIGLESASHEQLVKMKKTKDPKQYLDLADRLLWACAEQDIWVKFNLLLYAGETLDTVDETVEWLAERKDLIKDISVSSLVYYFNMDSISGFTNLGASVPLGEDIDKTGYIDLNLSDSIDFMTAKRLCVDIPKLIANQKDFYEVKAISYFEPDYSYEDFLDDVRKSDQALLPFKVDFDA